MKSFFLSWCLGLIVSVAGGAGTCRAVESQDGSDGTVHIPAYALPESSLLDSDTRKVLENKRKAGRERANAPNSCPSEEGANAAQLPAVRECEAQAFYKSPDYKHLRELYSVVMTRAQIGGVHTEIFVPTDGIAAKNAHRVLINVHGGGFHGGARTESHLESVPIASVGKIKVVSIDYRQAPEYAFPSASEDVEAVYRELTKTYLPGNIGIFGCSAGGLLTAQSVAWLEKKALPLPGGVGMFCAGAAYWTEGDSGKTGVALGWNAKDSIGTNAYFKNVSAADPLAFPVRSAGVLAKFPPSLLIAGTRDVALSSVVHTHSLLVARNIDAELHIWEGMGHAFFVDPDLPQSREVYSVIAKFFDAHLGQ